MTTELLSDGQIRAMMIGMTPSGELETVVNAMELLVRVSENL